jgi:hypothetical protein
VSTHRTARVFRKLEGTPSSSFQADHVSVAKPSRRFVQSEVVLITGLAFDCRQHASKLSCFRSSQEPTRSDPRLASHVVQPIDRMSFSWTCCY